MARQDIEGSIAHATMLGQCGVIDKSEADAICQGLEGILKDLQSGTLEIDMTQEDIHTFMEGELTRRLGDTGKRLHTARSRNDQVALDIRLYLREEAQGLLEKTWAAAVLQQGVKRLLLKGQAQLSLEAAQELAQGGLLLLGVEAMSVAPDDDPAPVHRALLEREVAVLESIDLRQVPAGDYILLAQPLKYGGLDGAQVRALLVEGSLEEA